MKALSLWQPWASLMALGVKRIETRGWYMAHRGPLAIHATSSWDVRATRFLRGGSYEAGLIRELLEERGIRSWIDLPLGAVVCTVEVVDCLATQVLLANDQVNKTELACGDFRPGRYGIVTANVAAFDRPISAKGRQGLWDVNV